MAIHTFGEYPDKFHPHVHAIFTDGLFNDTGLFDVMREADLKPLEDLFRAEVFKFLKKEGKITDELINKLMKWRHSGFSVDNGVRISENDEKGCELVAQYILRNPFSAGKITCIKKTGKVIYHSKKIWKDDPLICPECLSEMRIISFITEVNIIKKILKYLDLWGEESSRDPPGTPDFPKEILNDLTPEKRFLIVTLRDQWLRYSTFVSSSLA